MPLRFGPFVADRAAYRVLEGERTLDLTPKLLDLLFYLLDRPGVLVTKEALLDGVWPGANVTDNALAQAISELRDVLKDEPASPTYIRTVARRGYRFVAPVNASEAPAKPAPDVPTIEPAPARSIAVLDFTNVTGEADVAWLASGIAETVTSDLAALDHFRVVDRWRVVQAARNAGASMREMGTALGTNLLVTGSYQRSGPRLRLTARIVDLDRGDAVADAKVDGLLDDVFGLQDGIVSAFARELGVPGFSGSGRIGVRETSSLDAYRAYTEGWLKIESLDMDRIAESIVDFQRAIGLDSGYAMAYTGLAHAEFVAYEMTRTAEQPDVDALRSGIEHAKRAIRIDDQLAEAHSTLAFLLTSSLQFDAARAAGLRAVALEPESWRHHYRLGHAQWGGARLRSLERVLVFYPEFSFAHFETAMVLVARGQLDAAARLVAGRTDEQARQAHSGRRFPAIGFYWLAGALAAADGRTEAARELFDREVSLADRRRLYGSEYGAVGLVARGHAELALDQPARALETFRRAFEHVPGHSRAHIGEAAALERLGRAAEAKAAWDQAHAAEARLSQTGRQHDALLASACAAALRRDAPSAAARLNELLDLFPPSVTGWQIPIEPAFQGIRAHSDFQAVLARLAERAR